MSAVSNSIPAISKPEIMRPMLFKFYEAYLSEENDYGSERHAITNFLKDRQVKPDDINELDEMITVAEDKSCEAAFYAGFKTAMKFMKEVLA